MRTVSVVLLLVALIAGVAAAQPLPARSVAVLEFADETGQGFGVGSLGAALLARELAGRYRVAGAGRAASALDASGRTPADLTPAIAAEIGRRLGVDAVVVGRVTYLDVGPVSEPRPLDEPVVPPRGGQIAIVTVRLQFVASPAGVVLRRGEFQAMAVSISGFGAVRAAMLEAMRSAAGTF